MYNLNRSADSADLLTLNSSASNSTKGIMDMNANHLNEVTRKYFNSLAEANFNSFSTNSLPISLSTSRLNTSSLIPTSLSSTSSPVNLAYQLTTAVNNLVIDTLLTNSTPTFVTNPSNGSSFNETSSALICIPVNKTGKYLSLSLNIYYYLKTACTFYT